MKRQRVLVCAIILWPWLASATCTYVRTSYKKISCKPSISENEGPSDTVSSTTQLPGLEEAVLGPLDEVKCQCEYILEGSNPLCDPDREQEFSQTYPQDPSAPVCPRAKSLCASVCPQHLR